VTEAANVMRHWAQEHPAMTKAIMLFLGVGAGLLVLLGGLALAFGALTAAAAPLGIALGPLLLIVAGIAALAAAAYLVYDNWGPISAWFGGIWQGIRDMASGALAFLVNAFLTFRRWACWFRPSRPRWPICNRSILPRSGATSFRG
jgi:phage-related minor tail protein